MGGAPGSGALMGNKKRPQAWSIHGSRPGRARNRRRHGRNRADAPVAIIAFRAAVERFRATAHKHAQAVLDRLIAEEWRQHVMPVFELIPQERWEILIGDCLHAERAMRMHKRIVERAKRTIDEADKAAKALKIIAGFVRECRNDSEFHSTPSVTSGDDPEDEAPRVLGVRIYYCRLDAKRLLQLDRNNTSDPAARSAGIGWLAESILRLTDTPSRKLVADLAEAVLNLEHVSEAAVRNAIMPSERHHR
jgi:hypothetical protein